nr:hypothetical protein [Tanacetum cinerariifolium]
MMIALNAKNKLKIVTSEIIEPAELGHFVADKRCLTTLKVNGCSNLGGFVLCSTTLSTLWLSDLHSLSKMMDSEEAALNFNIFKSLLFDFFIPLCSLLLLKFKVYKLLRGLRMLSLVFGPEVTDASLVAISKCYSNLELLDLSGLVRIKLVSEQDFGPFFSKLLFIEIKGLETEFIWFRTKTNDRFAAMQQESKALQEKNTKRFDKVMKALAALSAKIQPDNEKSDTGSQYDDLGFLMNTQNLKGSFNSKQKMLEGVDKKSKQQAKRAKGLCYRCDKKFSPDHRCPSQTLQVLLVDESDGSEEEAATELQVKRCDPGAKNN